MSKDEKKAKKRHRSRSRSRSIDRGRGERRIDNQDRDRDRERDRERDKDRDRDRDRRRSRSRSSSRPRDKHRKDRRDRDRESSRDRGSGSNKRRDDDPKSPTGSSASVQQAAAPKSAEELEKDREAQREAEQAQLDEEMRKRRERVKAWQDAKAERVAAEAAALGLLPPLPSSSSASETAGASAAEATTMELSHHDDDVGDSEEARMAKDRADRARWSLEDEDEDEEDNTATAAAAPELDTEAIDNLPSVANKNTSADASEQLFDGALASSSIKVRNKRDRSLSVSGTMNNKDPEAAIKSAIGITGVLATNATVTATATAAAPSQAITSAIATANSSVVSAAPVIAAATATASALQSMPPSSAAAAAAVSSAVAVSEDFDPLEAFMTTLYTEGDVTQQKSLPMERAATASAASSTAGTVGPQGPLPPAAVVTPFTAATAAAPSPILGNNIGVAGGGGGAGESKGQDEGPGSPRNRTRPVLQTTASNEDEDYSSDYDEYSYLSGENPKFNPFGSNFITLDQIMQQQQHSSGRDTAGASNGLAGGDTGWESDSGVGGSSPRRPRNGDAGEESETEDDREEREERERREFIEGIKAARAAEEVARERLQKKDEAKEKSNEALGRVFAGEGDVMDETEIEEKKKTALELLEEQKKGKELKPIDHSAIEYMSFRKNLYIVPRALSRSTAQEIAEKREDLQIKVRGKGCPSPVETWEQCGLSDRILQVIQRHNLTAPFAIQKQAIPAVMCGRDIIGVAKTGSGKTLAFLLPMFRHIMDQPPLRDNEGPIGLIMAPARELAFQIYNEAKKFTKALGIRVACIYGGAGVADQIADLKRGAEIVVCTPGRMIDILCMQAGKLINLRRVTMVVMDEADRMFDMGFEPQIKMIIQNVRPDRQTVLFSATFPKQIEKLAKSVLRLPLEIVVGERSTVNKDIAQIVEVHDEQDKFMRLLQLLGVWYEKGSVLVFVDKQEKCDQLFQDLLKAGYPCLSLHGGKDQLDRDHTLHEFKAGLKTVMIATSVAGRGLDVPEIVVVINYNCPNHLEDYVHRVGRTGRAGRKGTAYTFLSPNEEQYSPIMVKALEKGGFPVPQELADMLKDFKEKVSKGEARWSSSGFEGKGYTFDASELSETQKNATAQRKAYELEQGITTEKADDEGEMADDELEDDEDRVPGSVGLLSGLANAGEDAGSNPLERARAIAASLCRSKGLPVPEPVVPVAPPAGSTASSAFGSSLVGAASQAAALAAMTGQTIPPCLGTDGKIDIRAALAKAKVVATQIAAGVTVDGIEKKDTAAMANAHYSDELDINDYPPQARRKVTNRNALDDITETTGVAIISRGSYVAPGKKPEGTERRLHLLIEGSSEMQIRQVKNEIVRLLEEETLRIGVSGGGGSFGRYSVT